MDTLVDTLQLAKMVESVIQTETLSKQLLQNVGKLGNMTTEVHSVTKHSQSHNRQNHSKSNHGRSQSCNKNGKKCGNCGHTHPPKQCLTYRKECFKCKKKNHFSTFCWSSVVPKRLVIPNASQGKMFMKWKTLAQQSLSMTLTVWNLNAFSSWHPCLNSISTHRALRTCLTRCPHCTMLLQIYVWRTKPEFHPR